MQERDFDQLDEELIALCQNPKRFSEGYDGERPRILDVMDVPKGWVVCGQSFKNQEKIKGLAFRIRPESEEAEDLALSMMVGIRVLKKIEDQEVLFLVVKESDDIGGWQWGPVFVKDLDIDPTALTHEAFYAAYLQDFFIEGIKRRAILAQVPPEERNKYPFFEMFDRSLDPFREAAAAVK